MITSGSKSVQELCGTLLFDYKQKKDFKFQYYKEEIAPKFIS